VQDLSRLADNSLTATSQGAGNMMSSNATAMTAPGSQPVTPLPPARDQDTPNMEMSPRIPVSWTGKPQASKQAGDPRQPQPAWGKTTTPDVIRTPPPAPPEPEGTAMTASIGVAGPSRATGRAAGAAAASTLNALPGGGDS
jgi:hypothetical protein